jgi:hypothetical protein
MSRIGYLKALWLHSKVILSGMASIIINVVQMVALRATTNPARLNSVLFWSLLAITVGSFAWANFLAWQDQYSRAEAHRDEANEMYADMVLYHLRQTFGSLGIFSDAAVAKAMDFDLDKVQRGLGLLETKCKVVGNNGARGKVYIPSMSADLTCQIRRLIPSKS